MEYRITYRHEVIIEADSDSEAKQKWEALELGQLDREESVVSHEYIETVSFEDEDYNEVSLD
jgi:hypothetical protein